MNWIFQRRKIYNDLSAELEQHLQEKTDELVENGMPREEAMAKARRDFGNVTRTEEQGREPWQWPAFESLVFDIRYALRQLRMQPAFAIIAILILAIGIGANTTVFSVVKRLVLEPLPFRAPERMIAIINADEPGLSARTSTVATYEALRTMQSLEETTSYEAFFARSSYKLTGDAEPDRVAGVIIEKNLFAFLGVVPLLGRAFNEAECKKNGPGAVMLSHELWERRYNADPKVVGRQVMLNDRAATIVGVLPRAFDFGEVFAPGVKISLYVPAVFEEIRTWGNTMAILGRMRPNATPQTAQAEASLIVARQQKQHPEFGPQGSYNAIVKPFEASVTGAIRRPMMILWAAVGLVLLIVCVNLSNLLLARAASRRKEMAVRGALGAGSMRLVRQMLTETLVLSLLGGGLGIAFAYAAIAYVKRFEGLSIPLLRNVEMDGLALATAGGITLLTAFLFGLAPAITIVRGDLATTMKDVGRSATEGRDHRFVRSALVVSEVALACLLLVGAGLLLRSFSRVLDINLGFQPEGTYALRIDPNLNIIDTGDKTLAYMQRIVNSVRTVPGVKAASFTDAIPLESNRSWYLWAKEDGPQKGVGALVKMVAPGLLETMGTRLLAGRDFDDHDTQKSQLVMMVNETLARQLWPNRDPLLGVARCINRDWKVVGVVRDVRHLTVEKSAGPEFYLPAYALEPRSGSLVVRTARPFSEVAPALRRTLSEVAPDLPTAGFRPLDQIVDRAVSQRRFISNLLASFAGVALLLAAIGIYGVISYSVSRRTSEIGIRMALGASGGRIRAGVVRDTLALAAIGVVFGAVCAVALSSLLTSLLFGVTAGDPPTYAAASGILLLVALAAGFVPAFRASRISPMTALRAE